MWRSVVGGYSIIRRRWRRGNDAVGHGCFTSFCTGNGLAGEKEQIHDASLFCLHNPMSSIRPTASFHFSSIPKQLFFNYLPTKVLKNQLNRMDRAQCVWCVWGSEKCSHSREKVTLASLEQLAQHSKHSRVLLLKIEKTPDIFSRGPPILLSQVKVSLM
jgi:hypothetical protein